MVTSNEDVPSTMPPATPVAEGARAPSAKAIVMTRSAVSASGRPISTSVAVWPPAVNRTSECAPAAVRSTPAPLSPA